MKIVLVCIAKNEDRYIQEWVEYHVKLGFDNIFIYENDWVCEYNHPKLIKIPIHGNRQQIPAYNDFIQKNKNEYDWAAFLDCDEFIVLKKHKTIKDLMVNYQEHHALGINWVLFGDNNLSKNNNFSVINRFTMCSKTPDVHIKSIINLKKSGWVSVHNHNGLCVDTNLTPINNTPFNHNGPTDIAQINHYFCKTKDEFIEKVIKGRADTGKPRDISDFDVHNHNEVEDLTAYKFYNDL